MVELRTRKRQMRGDGGNHHETLVFERIWGGYQSTITVRAGTVPIMWVISLIRCLPNPIRQVIPMISIIRLYPSHLAHLRHPSHTFTSTTLLSLRKTTREHPSLSLDGVIISWHSVQHTPSTVYTEYSLHWVQHTPNSAYTEYSKHWVHGTPGTASTQHCLSSLHSHENELTPEYSFSFQDASVQDRPPTGWSPCEFKGKVIVPHSHSCKLTYR
jgi:hypothetical protein